MRVWKGAWEKAQSVPWARVSACVACSGRGLGPGTQRPDLVGMGAGAPPVLLLARRKPGSGNTATSLGFYAWLVVDDRRIVQTQRRTG